MHARACAAQPVRIGWYEDEMQVVRHQAPHLDACIAALLSEQIAIERIVASQRKSERGHCRAG
jgi:hypothetical protein